MESNTFGSLKIGDAVQWRHRISLPEVAEYIALSGDTNPLHMDDDFARQLGYRGRVVHGMLCAAYLSRVIGTRFPGPGSVWLSQSLKFLVPVYIDDEIEITITVTRKSEALRAVTLSTEATNQRGEKVLTGEAIVMVPNRPHHIPWDGMVAIVTGSSRGIGAAVARSLGGQGVNVVVNYLTQAETAEAVVADIRARGGKAVAAQADVSTTEGAQSLFEAAEKHFGKIDVIVNNASPSIVRKPFSELKFADLENYWNGYVRGAFELIQLAIPGMRRREFGRIVNILTSSLIGAPPPELTAYVTAKSALMGLSKAAAVELGRWGITVNMVSPSIVLTDQWNGISESQLRALGLRVPLGRLAQAEEVASVVVFLLSEQGQYLNGVNIPITGGREM